MKTRKPSRVGRILGIAAAGLAGLCLVLAGVSAIINRSQPAGSTVVDRLSELDKIRLEETIHLRQALGDEILPGFGQAEIPVVLYNEAALFLVGIEDPAPGWQTVPWGKRLGRAWEEVPGDSFMGQPYYRQALPESGETTQAFTVKIGEQYAASMPTLEWSRISMTDQMRDEFGPLGQVLPVPLMVKLLFPSSDSHASLVVHEAVHAYQGMQAPARLDAAERDYSVWSQEYPWDDAAFVEAWDVELDLLTQALRADDPAETRRLAQAFLEQRAARRAAAGLSAEMIEMERQREWEEGIAKYSELSISVLAAETEGYAPLPGLTDDPEFKNYSGAQDKWDRDVAQIRLSKGDTRFYYTGFAQAVLLDRLAAGWKDRLWEEGVWLEEILGEVFAE